MQYMVTWIKRLAKLTWRNSVLDSLESLLSRMLRLVVLTCPISTTSSTMTFRRSRRSAYTEWDVQLALAERAGPTAFVDTSIFRIYWTYNCSLANGYLSADPMKTQISPKIS